MMIPTQLYVGPNQENRIMKALKRRRGCCIKVRKGAATSHRCGEMLLTPQKRIKYRAFKWEINEYYIQAQRLGRKYEA